MLRTLIAVLAFAPLCCGQSQSTFRWIAEVDGSGSGQLAGLGTDAQGNVYLAGTTRSPNSQAKGVDVFVTKLDPSGSVIYSTYFGGSADEYATAMTVGADGSVYVAGYTTSTDLPTTLGAYAPSAPPQSIGGGFLSFLFKVAPDGSVGYATYFSNSQTTLNAIAVDRAGSVYVTGLSYGGLATTPGVYRTSCTCIPPSGSFSFFAINDAFLARFDSAGSQLLFSTYLNAALVASAIAVAPDGSAYVAGGPTRSGTPGVFHLDGKGTSVIASAATGLNTQAMVLADDGNLYLTGLARTGSDPFRTTPGAFQTSSGLGTDANSPEPGIVKMDAALSSVLAGTYFGGAFGGGVRVLTLDAAGNLYIGGYTSPRSLPTRAPLMQGFGLSITGYVAELSADLSTLLFSSPFGDNETFGVNGLAIGANGNVVLAGTTGLPSQNVWANSVVLAEPPALRIDAIQNQASYSDPLSAGETIVIRGAGFETGAQVSIGGVIVMSTSISSTNIAATVPSGLSGTAATVQVLSNGAASNSVLVALSK